MSLAHVKWIGPRKGVRTERISLERIAPCAAVGGFVSVLIPCGPNKRFSKWPTLKWVTLVASGATSGRVV